VWPLPPEEEETNACLDPPADPPPGPPTPGHSYASRSPPPALPDAQHSPDKKFQPHEQLCLGVKINAK